MKVNEMKSEAMQPKSILISGASFAGLSTAYWMNRLGYAVTVVEIGKSLKTGGTPVDIRESTIDTVRRMGLLERVAAISLQSRPTAFVDAYGGRVAGMPPAADASVPEYEVERDRLLQMQFEDVKHDVEFIFGDSIAHLEEQQGGITVTFHSGLQRKVSLVFGCDGIHSAVRRLWFGEEAAYSLFLQNYFSVTIVPRLLMAENRSQLYNVPGKVVMLNTYNGKTDIAFCFFSAKEIPYDYRDQAQQRRMILQQFEGEGWRARELLDEVSASEDFYFDKLCQIRMPCWTKGRVALVGDAAYCASPAAGMGGSLAIVGATALADAFKQFPESYEQAFAEYERSLRPFTDKVQKEAIEVGLAMFAPRTEEEIRKRNQQLQIG